jgi:hypothetical protein
MKIPEPTEAEEGMNEEHGKVPDYEQTLKSAKVRLAKRPNPPHVSDRAE